MEVNDLLLNSVKEIKISWTYYKQRRRLSLGLEIKSRLIDGRYKSQKVIAPFNQVIQSLGDDIPPALGLSLVSVIPPHINIRENKTLTSIREITSASTISQYALRGDLVLGLKTVALHSATRLEILSGTQEEMIDLYYKIFNLLNKLSTQKKIVSNLRM